VSSCAAASEIYGEHADPSWGYEVFVEIGPKPTLLRMGRNACQKEWEFVPSAISRLRGLATAPSEFGGIVRA